jgi:hypothetical protein
VGTGAASRTTSQESEKLQKRVQQTARESYFKTTNPEYVTIWKIFIVLFTAANSTQ